MEGAQPVVGLQVGAYKQSEDPRSISLLQPPLCSDPQTQRVCGTAVPGMFAPTPGWGRDSCLPVLLLGKLCLRHGKVRNKAADFQPGMEIILATCS